MDKDLLIRIAAVALLLYSLYCFFSTQGELTRLRQTELIREAAWEQARTENAALRERVSAELTDEELERLARSRLGMVRQGEKIFRFGNEY